MKLEAMRNECNEVIYLAMHPDGEDDTIFLTCLFKAFMFGDAIEFPEYREGRSLTYRPSKSVSEDEVS